MGIKRIHINTSTELFLGERGIQEVLDEIELHCMQASLDLKYLEDKLEDKLENKEDISSVDWHINQILNLIRE